jgi:hypothetical protein
MFSLRTAFILVGMITIFAGCTPRPTETNSEASTVETAQVDFSNRFGVAVRTASRTCVAIKNQSLSQGSPITLIQPQTPQTFTTAEVSAPSSDPCPVSANTSRGFTSYQISFPKSSPPLTKLTPFILYAGPPTAAGFTIDNNNVEADLDGNHSKNTFRACSATGEIYLSVWRGSPLVGTRLWAARYDDPENAGAFPVCDPKELYRVANRRG